MNKLVCLFITLVMLLGSASSLFASIKTDTCTDCFGEFVVDQIQKNFSQTLSTTPQKENQNSDNLISLYILNPNLQDNFYKKSLSNHKFISKTLQLESNILFFSGIRRYQGRHQGLKEYIMNLNSFIAINTVNDEYISAFFCI